MKLTRSLLLAVPAAFLLAAHVANAAPVESVDSNRATVQIQKIERFLSQDAVSAQLTAIGLTQAQVSARLARLSDTQLEQMAAQIDLVQAGGTMQGAGVMEWNPLGCILAPIGRMFYNIYQILFCWGDLK
jgi:hypothetical protein